jgi:hypothetical protein
MFDISLTTVHPEDPDDGVSEREVYGQIQIGDFSESFVASLAVWSPLQYEEQWREAAKRLVDGHLKSAFVTSYVAPNVIDWWWPCYLSGETVYIHNQLCFSAELFSDFKIEALYDFVGDRKIVDDDRGEAISEWQVSLDSMREFLRLPPK